MRRDQWRFEYTAGKIAQAAAAKMKYHAERFDWWRAEREAVLQKIREEGLEIDEKIVLGYSSPKARDWENGARVSIRDDLRSKLEQCQSKLTLHQSKKIEYEGWHQALSANPDVALRLNIDDWLYFLGNRV